MAINKKIVYVFLFEGYSDWEISYLLPELNKSPMYELRTFSPDGDSVASMGGLRVQVDQAMQEVDQSNMAMLVLPGGDAWEEEQLREIIPLVEETHRQGIPVAAICGATTLLAFMGLLNDIEHTSNGKDYLKAIVPRYRGAIHYLEQGVVNSNNIITASGIAPIDFAREIFRELSLFDESNIEKWYQLFKNGVWIE